MMPLLMLAVLPKREDVRKNGLKKLFEKVNPLPLKRLSGSK